jgi:hypothetical protein
MVRDLLEEEIDASVNKDYWAAALEREEEERDRL